MDLMVSALKVSKNSQNFFFQMFFFLFFVMFRGYQGEIKNHKQFDF